MFQPLVNNYFPFRRCFYSKRTFEMGAGKEEQPQVVFNINFCTSKSKQEEPALKQDGDEEI